VRPGFGGVLERRRRLRLSVERQPNLRPRLRERQCRNGNWGKTDLGEYVNEAEAFTIELRHADSLGLTPKEKLEVRRHLDDFMGMIREHEYSEDYWENVKKGNFKLLDRDVLKTPIPAWAK
jgi:hypothetical protein